MWHIRREMRTQRHGLSMPQFRALVLIDAEPAVCLSAVADHLALSLPTTSRIVTGLVNKGFLRRTESRADRRQLSLGITSRGQTVLNAARAAAWRSMTAELSALKPSEIAAVTAAAKMVKKIFGSLGLPAEKPRMPKSKTPAKKRPRVKAHA